MPIFGLILRAISEQLRRIAELYEQVPASPNANEWKELKQFVTSLERINKALAAGNSNKGRPFSLAQIASIAAGFEGAGAAHRKGLARIKRNRATRKPATRKRPTKKGK